MRTDLLVIGSGMAGAVAAHSAREEGKEVLLVAKGYGATALSGGALDLQGTLTRGGRIECGPVEAAETRAVEERGHPYDLVMKWGDSSGLGFPGTVEKSMAMAVELVKSGGGPAYEGEPSSTRLLPNTAGTWKDTCMCQETMEGSDLLGLEDAPVLVVGIEGYNDFNADFISRSLAYCAKKLGLEANIRSMESSTITFPKTERTNIVTFRMATALESDAVLEEFKDSLARAIEACSEKPTHLFLPAVLARTGSARMVAGMEKDLGCRVCEVAPTRSSVPGYRLFRALEGSLEQAGIRYLYGEVTGWAGEDGKIDSVTVTTAGRSEEVEFESIVLATGKLIGGGLHAGEEVRESIFSLPVGHARRGGLTGSVHPPYKMLKADIFGDHDLFRAGVICDGIFRPLAGREAAYENLFACGALLGGANHAWERNGMGVAITTGYAAGKCASAV